MGYLTGVEAFQRRRTLAGRVERGCGSQKSTAVVVEGGDQPETWEQQRTFESWALHKEGVNRMRVNVQTDVSPFDAVLLWFAIYAPWKPQTPGNAALGCGPYLV